MKKTKIQWCHSTINPVMGCEGCELWPGSGHIATEIEKAVNSEYGADPTAIRAAIVAATDGNAMSDIYANRKVIAERLQFTLDLSSDASRAVVDAIRGQATCYAGLLGTMRAGHKGYADKFEKPQLYPGRMKVAAGWGSPTPSEVVDKPWLAGLPRLIFISDMGDALCKAVSFDYLRKEIVEQVCSAAGSRHIWLWLSKRPARMAKFSEWLRTRGIEWPRNLVAMTTVTEQSKASRVDHLRNVPSRFKGLSIEPLFERVELDLKGIDWVIVGGGSDVMAKTLHVEWALELKAQCHRQGVAFFFKQLGKNPAFQNRSLRLKDVQGGEWSEWPKAWRERQFPKFHEAR